MLTFPAAPPDPRQPDSAAPAVQAVLRAVADPAGRFPGCGCAPPCPAAPTRSGRPRAAAGGPDVTIKVLTGRWDDPQQTRSCEAAALTCWAGSGVTPAVLATADYPAPFLITRLAAGVPLSSPAMADLLVRRTSAVLAAVNALHHAGEPHHVEDPHHARGRSRTNAPTWPALLHTGWPPAAPARLSQLGQPAAARQAASALEHLRGLPVVLLHGDATPWNILSEHAGTVTLLDPLPSRGPAVWDVARWCVSAALTVMFGAADAQATPCPPQAEALLAQLAQFSVQVPATAATAGPRQADDDADLAAALRLELLNRASFADPRWPAAVAAVLLTAAARL